MSHLHYIMNDPEHFDKPEEFRPERFLDDEGNFQPNERVIPFSTGKRICPGLSLAEQELFLFFVKLNQSFSFECPPGHTLPGFMEVEAEPGYLGRLPPKFKIILKVRE